MTERFLWRGGRPRGLLVAADVSDKAERFGDVSWIAFFLNEPFGRPALFLVRVEPSGRSDCSLEVSSSSRVTVKDGSSLSAKRGRPRGFLGGSSLSLSSSSKKS